MEAIEAAFWPFRYSIQRLLQKPTSPYIPKLCQCVTPDITSQSTALAAPSEDCDTLMLGRVIQSLSGENLWPLPGITLQWSIGLLHSTLKRLNVRGSHLINHENCVAVKGLDEKFQGRVEDTWVNLTDAQKKHLESQARKSGFTE
ncbi:hypothetical protein F4778DRAFT_663062 [Xylariomycetidae sp. FL2044]|nr:hypothetical protein F4778DRAFT_663062 [Xylariomycetidae sp. FL2044]